MTASPAQISTVEGSEVAIVGGGISGLSAAYELTRLGVPFQLFESSARLGGTIETRSAAGFLMECGPDSWVAEKPWARELAMELGLGDQLVESRDEMRRTYLVRGLVRGSKSRPKLVAIPSGMRLIAPERWGPLLRSSLFGWGPTGWKTKLAYLLEPGRADELKSAAQREMADDTVAEFVTRHFGRRATEVLAAPLIAGIFGGDIHSLSARAVLPSFAQMEREHGSIITPLRDKRRSRNGKKNQPRQALFQAPAAGMEALVSALTRSLPQDRLHRTEPVCALRREGAAWLLKTPRQEKRFSKLILAAPAQVTREMIQPLGHRGQEIALLLPPVSSSAIVVALGFNAFQTAQLRIPPGFGFLFPAPASEEQSPGLLACTIVNQKFPGRVPPGGVLLRAFFGGEGANALLDEADETLVERACRQLAPILSPAGLFPEAAVTLVHRLPLSLPQYLIGHAGRMAELSDTLRKTPSLALIGNGYHGVGIPDLIHEARAAARSLANRDTTSIAQS